MTGAVSKIIDALRQHPLALALVIINVLYLVGGFVLYREERTRNAEVIRELIQHCVIGEDHP